MRSFVSALAITCSLLLSLPAAAQIGDFETNLNESDPHLSSKIRNISATGVDSIAHPDALKNAEPIRTTNGDGASIKEGLGTHEVKTFAPKELDKSVVKHDFTTPGEDPKAQLDPSIGKAPKAGKGLGANQIDGKAVRALGDCPKGFEYKAGAGCGPKPGFCPNGYAAKVKGEGIVCEWLQTGGTSGHREDICPKDYRRNGDTCVAN